MKNLKYLLLFFFYPLVHYPLHAQDKKPDVLNSDQFITLNGGLNNARYLIDHNKQLTVAFLGGSITHMDGWRNKVCDYLTSTYPDMRFTFIEAAIPSLGSVAHAFRLDRDVLSKGKIDLLFLESAVNDRGTPEDIQKRAVEGLIRHTREVNPHTEIIMMAFADASKIQDYHTGKVPTEVKVHDELSAYYQLPFINLALEVTRRIDHQEFNWERDFKSLHPAPFGQEVYFQSIKRLFELSFAKKSNGFVKYKLPQALDLSSYTHAGYITVRATTIINGFNVKSAWKPSDRLPVRPGYFNIDVLEGTHVGDSLKFTFTGSTVGIGAITGPDAGIICYQIDDGPVQKADLFLKDSKQLYFPYYLILGDQLSITHNHVLTIKISDSCNHNSNGTACRIAYLLVNN